MTTMLCVSGSMEMTASPTLPLGVNIGAWRSSRCCCCPRRSRRRGFHRRRQSRQNHRRHRIARGPATTAHGQMPSARVSTFVPIQILCLHKVILVEFFDSVSPSAAELRLRLPPPPAASAKSSSSSRRRCRMSRNRRSRSLRRVLVLAPPAHERALAGGAAAPAARRWSFSGTCPATLAALPADRHFQDGRHRRPASWPGCCPAG